MESSRGPVLQLELDRDAALPLHVQLERRLREDIRSGRLGAGAPLPSSRALAAALGVSRGVVSEAYVQLASEGYLTSRQGAPVRVATAVQRRRPREPARSLLPRFPYDLRPGVPDLASFPMDAWLRSLRAAWRDAPFDSLGQPDPRGGPQLREALAGQLARTRGVAADAEDVLVCGGFRDGFSILCRWLRASGVEEVAVEDPGWHPHRLAVEQAGMRVVAVPVDGGGVSVDALESSDAAVVVVTPAHQFPTGVVLSRERRAALVEWAAAGERVVVEDDYDSEFRYDGGGPGALQGLAADRVAYIGSASKRLAPGVRLGWMLTPSWLTWPLTAILAAEAGGADAIAQLALRDFVARGELDRHLRRMRARYERRRAALLGALARQLPAVRVQHEPAAGLFVLAELPEELDEGALVARAAELGVGVEGLELHRFEPRAAGAFAAADEGLERRRSEPRSGAALAGGGGLVLGFGALAEPALERAVALLASAART